MLAAVSLAAVSCILYAAWHSETEGHRRALVERGVAVADSLAASIQARGGRMKPCCLARLSATLDELARTPRILGVEIRHETVGVVARGGSASDFADVIPGQPLWRPGTLSVVRQYEFHPSSTPSDSSEEACESTAQVSTGPAWQSGAYLFAVLLNASDVEDMLRQDRLHFTLAAILATAAVGLGVASLWLTARHRRLETVLAVEQERATHLEKLSQLGMGLAHETKNPLGVVRGLAQTIAEAPHTSPEIRRNAVQIADQADETVRQINAFLDLSRPRKAQCGSVALDTLSQNLVELLRPDAERVQVTLSTDTGALLVYADETLLRRALLNLLINALKAVNAGGSVRIQAQSVDGTVSLRVIDDGCGIRSEDLPNVTQPYFSRYDGGTGLGLAIVEQIARAHGWTLAIDSTLGKGTQVSIRGIPQIHASTR